jgi:hypothetical protein
VRCHRFEELESELPARMKLAHDLFGSGDLNEAKSVANEVALKNRQLCLPGIDEELRVLFQKIKSKRADKKNMLYGT